MPVASLRKHKILTAVGALILLVLLVLIGLIIFSEPLIRTLTEQQGSEKTGRSITIEGDLRISWHWTHTRVHAEDIHLANAPGYPDPDMLAIATLDFTFKPLKLLLGKLEFDRIALVKPVLILQRKSEGDMNWRFPAFSQADVVSEAALADDRHNFPIIHQLSLSEGQVIYRDAVKGMSLTLSLDSFKGRSGKHKEGSPEKRNKNDPVTDEFPQGFRITGEGLMQQKPFTLKASGGSLETLRGSDKPFPLELTLIMGATKVAVSGEFQDPVALKGIDAQLTITGHNLADLFYLTAIPLPPTPPYELRGQLTKTEGIWGYREFSGKVGGSDLAGDLSYDTRGERGFLRAQLVSNVLDSKDLGGFIGLPPAGENAAPEQQQAAAEKEASPTLIPDVPLRLERLRATDLDVTLTAKKITAPGLPFKGMDVRFLLKNGLLTLDPLNVTLADGSVDGALIIDARKNIPPMNVNVNLRNLSLGQFFNNTRFETTTQGVFGGTVNLSGEGASLAEVLASSNGDIAVIMSGGKISQLLVEASDLDLGQALPLFLGKDQPTEIRCGVADFIVANGVLDSKVVVLDTDDSRLVGDVVINLKDEVINAKLDAKPKDSSIFSVKTPITVTGTLKNPAVGVEGKKAFTQGAKAVALGVLLSPFAAVIPFIESGEEKNADCRALIQAAQNDKNPTDSP